MVGDGERPVAADDVEPVDGVGPVVIDVPAFDDSMAGENVPVAVGGDVDGGVGGGGGGGGMMVEVMILDDDEECGFVDGNLTVELVIDDGDVVYID